MSNPQVFRCEASIATQGVWSLGLGYVIEVYNSELSIGPRSWRQVVGPHTFLAQIWTRIFGRSWQVPLSAIRTAAFQGRDTTSSTRRKVPDKLVLSIPGGRPAELAIFSSKARDLALVLQSRSVSVLGLSE